MDVGKVLALRTARITYRNTGHHNFELVVFYIPCTTCSIHPRNECYIITFRYSGWKYFTRQRQNWTSYDTDACADRPCLNNDVKGKIASSTINARRVVHLYCRKSSFSLSPFTKNVKVVIRDKWYMTDREILNEKHFVPVLNSV